MGLLLLKDKGHTCRLISRKVQFDIKIGVTVGLLLLKYNSYKNGLIIIIKGQGGTQA